MYLGIDFGTSGARAAVIDDESRILAAAEYAFPLGQGVSEPLSALWQRALFSLLAQISPEIRLSLKRILINGTSATVLLCDRHGEPVTEPLLYNDNRAIAVIESLRAIAPANNPVISATSSLAKLLWWQTNLNHLDFSNLYFMHQADWLSFLLHGQLGISDYHNTLKLGADPETLSYPQWLLEGLNKIFADRPPHLPKILQSGCPIGVVTAEIAEKFHLAKNCLVCAGTTDSIAAFLASGANQPGQAVTSLGSTLVLKLLSHTRVDDARYGIYSHRLGNLWLTGGASNTGGAVLRQFFTNEELTELSDRINPQQVTSLDYYPLIKPGERFPINDPQLLPRLDPRPDQPEEFLHGLLEAMAKIEAKGYGLLQQFGASSLTQVYTAGGGAKNAVWTEIRQRYLQVPVMISPHTEAAYGSAMLSKMSATTFATI
jgi:sugar (pentulose or hexulose) kinase